MNLDVFCERFLQGRLNRFHVVLHDLQDACFLVVLCQSHTITELGIVLKQGVCPCNTLTVLVVDKRSGRCRRAVDHGASGSVGNHHVTTEQLRYELVVRCLTAARAGTGYLEVRHQELRTLYRIRREVVALVLCMLEQVICQRFFVQLLVDVDHLERLVAGLARTLNCTQTAADAVCR